MGDTTHGYVPRDYRRVCDQCGLLFNRSRLHRKGPWIFCDICDARGDRIREEEDAAIARQRPFRILPVPNAKPLTVDSPYEWEAEEAFIFDFIAMTSPSKLVGESPRADAAAWAATYMGDIIIEGERPEIWLSSARKCLDTNIAYLLSIQYGSITGPSVANSNPRYGGFLRSGVYTTSDVIQAGLAFLRAFQVTGEQEHLNGAKRCATFIRRAQCRDLQTPYTTYPSGGAAYHVGGVSASLAESNSLLSSQYNLADVSAAEFLVELGDELGMSATFGDAASTSFFTAATQATIETMIDEITAFGTTGAKDANASGEYVSGLDPERVRQYYTAASSNGSSGAGVWNVSTTTTGAIVASAIKGIFAVNGSEDSTVTATLAWLADFTANSSNATPSTNTQQRTYDTITGDYDPAVAPAVSLKVQSPFTESTGTLYDLAALGMLAPVLAETDPAVLRDSRSTLSPGQRFSVFDLSLRPLGPMGRAGLSLQPHSGGQTIDPETGQITPAPNTQDVTLAAAFGNIYRYVNP